MITWVTSYKDDIYLTRDGRLNHEGETLEGREKIPERSASETCLIVFRRLAQRSR